MRHTHSVVRWVLVVGLLVFLASPALATSDRYYLSLGTSLAAGVEPNRAGIDAPTDEGYADQLHRLLKVKDRRLRLVKLGCPGETTISMITGVDSDCAYPAGSQLAQAVAFLQANPGAVSLVTIDVGANDLLPCVGSDGIHVECIFDAFANVGAILPGILAELRTWAGPGVPIVAMNYYNPFVAAWLQGPDGQAMARQSAELLALFNALLEDIYTADPKVAVLVGDVARAFHADDFRLVPVIGLPANVALVCQATWMCTPPPKGPDIHPNRIGYFVIALVLASVLK